MKILKAILESTVRNGVLMLIFGPLAALAVWGFRTLFGYFWGELAALGFWVSVLIVWDAYRALRRRAG